VLRHFLNPAHVLRIRFDQLVVMMQAWEGVVGPFITVFNYYRGSWILFGYLTDLLTVIKIVASLWTVIHDSSKGTYIDNPKQIRAAYLKTAGFKSDVLATLPFELFALMAGYDYTSTVFCALRLNRMLRFVNVHHHLNLVPYSKFDIYLFQIGSSMYFMFMITHWVACLWWMLGRWESERGNVSWVAMKFPEETSSQLNDFAWRHYIVSLHWTIQTTTTVGYGDIAVHTEFEHLFVSFVMLLGSLMFAFILGLMTTLVSRMDQGRTDFRTKFTLMRNFLKYRKVPEDIVQRIMRYNKQSWEQTMGYDETEIMNQLPGSIRIDLSLHLYSGTLLKVPLFENCEHSFLRALAPVLTPEIFPAGETIIRVGDFGREMFFLLAGRCGIVEEHSGELFKEFSEGAYFGELALLYRARRTATICSINECDMLVLTRENLIHILSDYPAVEKAMRSEAERRRQMQMSKIMDMWRRANRVKDAHKIIEEGKLQGKTAAISIAQHWAKRSKHEDADTVSAARLAAAAKEAEQDSSSKMTDAQITEFKRATVMLDKMGKDFSETMEQLQKKVETLEDKAERTIDGKTSSVDLGDVASEAAQKEAQEQTEWEERGPENMTITRLQLAKLIGFIENDIPRLKSKLGTSTDASPPSLMEGTEC